MTDQNNNTTKPVRCQDTMDGKLCKPSRKLFEQQCRQLADEIHSLNSKLAQNKAGLNELFAKLDRLREERIERFTQKSSVEDSVRAMSVNINKVSERLAQLQSKLHYRDMSKLENAIRSLQVHLDSHHFKHSEEKKIVAEIDKLNRSKKVVGEFLSTQSELKQLRSSQHSKRVDRDKLIKDIVRIRKQEDETRVNITEKKELDSTLNTELAELKETKHSLKDSFAKQQQTYSQQRAAIKQADLENKQRRQQMCRQSSNIPTRCLGSSTQDCEPQTPEMTCCHHLIDFCQRLTRQHGDEKAVQRQLKKKISYTPDVLSQFVSIDVLPPMTVLQAQQCIPLLKQKLDHLHHMQKVAVPVVVEQDSLNQYSDVTDSQEESGITSDVPTHTKPEQRSISIDDHPDITDREPEQPDDQSDRSSLTKQLSNTSEEDTMDSIMHKLTILDSLYQIETELKSNDNFLA